MVDDYDAKFHPRMSTNYSLNKNGLIDDLTFINNRTDNIYGSPSKIKFKNSK